MLYIISFFKSNTNVFNLISGDQNGHDSARQTPRSREFTDS